MPPLVPPRPRPGEFGQAGDLAPKTGGFSDAFRAGLGRLFLHPAPLFSEEAATGGDLNYGGTGVQFTPVLDAAWYREYGYGGDLPAATQPTVQRSTPPWG